MKLLIVTQTVDLEDQVLGFFIGWINTFAKNCTEVHVLCLNEGVYTFPENVHIHCLGKSEGKPKIVWFFRLLRYSWILRNKYDNVFVHMNAIHVVLCGFLWRLLGKKIGFWYTHPTVDLKLRLGTWMTHIIFTGSKNSFGIKTNKKNVMGQGVDPSFFTYKEHINIQQPVLVVVGRISPIKNIGISLEVLSQLRKKYDTRLSIVGGPSDGSHADAQYLKELKRQAEELQIAPFVTWHGPKNGSEVRGILRSSDIFIHTSLTHSADKTLPEAMASGLCVVSSNKAYEDDLPSACFKPSKVDEYVSAVESFIQMSEYERNLLRKKLRVCVEKKHSLERLVQNIIELY